MNQRFCTSIFLLVFLGVGFSACAVQRISQRSDVTFHSVHTLDFDGKVTIVGIVADTAGDFFGGASVALFDVDTETLKNEAEVQPDGTYKMTNISPDKYRLQAKAAGFKTVQVNDLKLRANSLVVLDFYLSRNK